MKLTQHTELETKEVIIGWLFLLFPSSSKLALLEQSEATGN